MGVGIVGGQAPRQVVISIPDLYAPRLIPDHLADDEWRVSKIRGCAFPSPPTNDSEVMGVDLGASLKSRTRLKHIVIKRQCVPLAPSIIVEWSRPRVALDELEKFLAAA